MKRVRTDKNKQNRYVIGQAKLLYAINYLGRYCRDCHFDGFVEPWFMDFHHRDPKLKKFEVKNKVMHFSFNRIQDEIDKCDLLCGQCHRRLHSRNDLYEAYHDPITSKYEELLQSDGIIREQQRFTSERHYQRAAAIYF